MGITAIREQPAAMPQSPEHELGVQDYMRILLRRRAVFIQVFILVVVVGVVATVLSKPVYQTQARLAISSAPPTMSIGNINDPLAPLMTGLIPDNAVTTLSQLQSREFLREARKEADLPNRPGVVPPSVRSEIVENSNVIAIAVEGGSVDDIVKLGKTILNTFRKKQIEFTTKGLRKVETYLLDMRRTAQDESDAAEAKLRAFNDTHRVFSQKARSEAQATAYGSLLLRVSSGKSTVAGAQGKVNILQAQYDLEPERIPQEDTQVNPLPSKLSEQIAQLEVNRETLLQQYKPTHPNIKSIDEQIATLKKARDAQPPTNTIRMMVPNPRKAVLKSQLDSARQELVTAQADLGVSQSMLQAAQAGIDSGDWQVAQERLIRERDRALESLTSAKNRLADVQLRLKSIQEPFKVIENPQEPKSPIRPRKPVNLALTLVLGVILATAVALLQEYLDDRINSPEDLERLTALPTLGYVPFMQEGEDRLVSSLAANSHVSESYRALRSSIGFAGIDQAIRRLQVTSARKGEGKSTTSVNIAISMAMDGKKVILIDADMRRPSVHRLMETTETPGLSEVLVGMKTLDEALRPGPVPNLQFLAAGPIPPNPAELLGSESFEALLVELDARADVVIFDTPPCLPVTDPLLVASRMDGVIVVLHAGETRKAAAQGAIELLRRAHARILGVVMNHVRQQKGGYEYSYQYYYHNYSDSYYAADEESNGKPTRKRIRQISSGASGASKPVGTSASNGDRE